MSRNRTIYFCSAAVKSVLQSADFERLHLVFTGVRLFVRQGGAAGSEGDEFRLTSEGIPLLERVIVDQHRQVSVPESALRTVLEHNNPALRDFDDTTRPILEALGKRKKKNEKKKKKKKTGIRAGPPKNEV